MSSRVLKVTSGNTPGQKERLLSEFVERIHKSVPLSRNTSNAESLTEGGLLDEKVLTFRF